MQQTRPVEGSAERAAETQRALRSPRRGDRGRHGSLAHLKHDQPAGGGAACVTREGQPAGGEGRHVLQGRVNLPGERGSMCCTQTDRILTEVPPHTD